MANSSTPFPSRVFYLTFALGSEAVISETEPLPLDSFDKFNPTIQALSLDEANRLKSTFSPLFKQSRKHTVSALMDSLKELRLSGVKFKPISDRFYPVFHAVIPGTGEKRLLIYRDLKIVKPLLESDDYWKWKRCYTAEASLIFLLSEFLGRQRKFDSISTRTDRRSTRSTNVRSQVTNESISTASTAAATEEGPTDSPSQAKKVRLCKTCHQSMKGHKVVCPSIHDIVKATENLSISRQGETEPRNSGSSYGRAALLQYKEEIAKMAILGSAEPISLELHEDHVIVVRRFALQRGLFVAIFDKDLDDKEHDDQITLLISSSKSALKSLCLEL